MSDSEEEEPKAQGRKSQYDPLDSLVQGLVTPSTTKVNASGEEQGRRYKRRKETKGKKVVSSLDFQEEVDAGAKQVNTASAEQVSTAEGVSTGSTKLSTGDEQLSTGNEQVSTVGAKKSTSSQDKGQREGKAPMQAKIEANAELSKSMLGSELQGEDFAKKMVDLVNQRKKYFAEERARAKRNKPMTQSQLKTYMMNYLKNQGTWKLSQLKNLSFEEVKEEFDKLVKQVESFAPINFEATKASLKRFGEELQTKTPKRLKDDEAKDDEPTKKSGKRRKQMARRGLHTDIDKDDSEGSDKLMTQEDLYGMDGPEDKLEKIFWKYLKDMFEEPLSTDPVWSLFKSTKDHKKYPLSSAEIDMVINPPWNLPFLGAKGLTSPEQTATGKGISNPFMAVMVCQKPYGIQLTNVSCTEKFKWFSVNHRHTPFCGQDRRDASSDHG
ncbi:hypothetical protein Tco_1289303 [Tanacetum coccineum]